MENICRQLGYTRQAYYKQKRKELNDEFEGEIIIGLVRTLRKSMPRLGTRKLCVKLANIGMIVGRDRLFALLRERRMLVKRRRRNSVTTNSKHWLRKYPNLIRGLVVNAPNQLWVSDITYIVTDGGFVYLSLITDAYSHKIVGWALSDSLGKQGVVDALEMALNSCSTAEGLIHHSDRGIQYCSGVYVDLLKSNGIKISMTENGDPYENAIAERVNGILKSEWIDHERYESLEVARVRIDEIIDIYNNLRPHMSCGMLTPEVAHRGSGELKQIWRKRKDFIPSHPTGVNYRQDSRTPAQM